ncbi:MAG: hypothetical protein ACD_75C00530G0001 [uncultured bacterium]|nr:MAG: hypothetical protein ACD_75C00530G0001 [uncultured bacterium]
MAHIQQNRPFPFGHLRVGRHGFHHPVDIVVIAVGIAGHAQRRTAHNDLLERPPLGLEGPDRTEGADIAGQVVGLFHVKHMGGLDDDIAIAVLLQIAHGLNDVFHAQNFGGNALIQPLPRLVPPFLPHRADHIGGKGDAHLGARIGLSHRRGDVVDFLDGRRHGGAETGEQDRRLRFRRSIACGNCRSGRELQKKESEQDDFADSLKHGISSLDEKVKNQL